MAASLRRGAALALAAALAAGWALCAPAPESGDKDPRSPREIEESRRDLRHLQKLAEDPKPDLEELWMAWQRFRTAHAGTPEWRQACEVMAKAPSPLDELDREQIPAEDRPPWLPKEVVAVLGEHRGRHGLGVTEIVVSPDGRWIVTVGGWADHLWDAATLQLRALFGASSRFRAFLPDGKSLLTCNSDGEARLWDVSTDGVKEKAAVKGFDPQLGTMRFAADGKTTVTVDFDKTIKLWRMKGEQVKEQARMPGRRTGKFAFHCAAKAMTLADLCGPNETGRVWDISKEPPELRCTVPLPWATPTALSPDGTLLASGGKISDNDILLWDISGKEAKVRERLLGHLGQVEDLAFSADGQTLASVGLDQVLRRWPLTDERRKTMGLKPGVTHEAQALPFLAMRVALEADNKTAVFAGGDVVHLWDMERREERSKPQGPVGELDALAFSPDGRTLAAGGREEVIRLWDLTGAKPKERAKLEGHTGLIDGLAFSPSGDNLVSKAISLNYRNDGTTRLWDLKGKEPRQIAIWKPHTSCNCFVYAPNGQLVTAGRDGFVGRTGGASVRLWDVADGLPSERAHLQFEEKMDEDTHIPEDEQANSVTISPQGHLVAFRTEFDNVRLYDITADGFRPRAVLHPFPMGGGIQQLALSPDGATLIAGGLPFYDASSPMERSYLCFWAIDAKGANPEKLFGGKPQLSSRAWTFCPDGKMLAAEQFGTVVVWDVASGRAVWKWETPWTVTALAYAPDGRHLAMATYDGLVYLLYLGTASRNGGD